MELQTAKANRVMAARRLWLRRILTCGAVTAHVLTKACVTVFKIIFTEKTLLINLIYHFILLYRLVKKMLLVSDTKKFNVRHR